MEAEEVWKPVVGFALKGAYEVSSEGRIRSYLRRGQKGTFDTGRFSKEPRLLSTNVAPGTYVIVKLVARKGRPKYTKVHILVAEAFLGPRPDGVSKKGRCTWDVDHINNDPRDNRACNLRYIPHAENCLRSPLHPARNPRRGSQKTAAKLTEADVIKIRQMAADGWTRRDLGALFGVSNVCITHAVNRQTWKHV